MKIDYAKLEAGLLTLSGLDFEECEVQERAAGNASPELTFSKSFQIRLAAKALQVNVHDLKALPLKEYAQVGTRVFNFLFATSDQETQLTD